MIEDWVIAWFMDAPELFYIQQMYASSYKASVSVITMNLYKIPRTNPKTIEKTMPTIGEN